MYIEAIEAATVLGARFPFAKASTLMWQAVTARCQSKLARASEPAPDDARASFLAAIEDAHTHNVFFMEMVLARDLLLHERLHAHTHAKLGGGLTPAAEAAGLLQRAVGAMPGSGRDLIEMLRAHGLEAVVTSNTDETIRL